MKPLRWLRNSGVCFDHHTVWHYACRACQERRYR